MPVFSVRVSVVAVATTVTVWFGKFTLRFSVLPLSMNVDKVIDWLRVLLVLVCELELLGV